jgi:hypothetical protein
VHETWFLTCVVFHTVSRFLFVMTYVNDVIKDDIFLANDVTNDVPVTYAHCTQLLFLFIYCLMIFLSCVLDFCAWSVQPLESFQSMLLKSIVCLYLVFKYEWNRMAMIFMLTVIC